MRRLERNLHAVVLAGSICTMAPQVHAQEDISPIDGEIVVTAQRRSERLQDVPISITALSAETLERSGVNSTQDLARITPGLQLPFNGGYIQPSIRGVNSSNFGSSNVAFYVDGVYQSTPAAQLMDLSDVQQIEVLKGPQGTLYGQNALGGAITVTTLAPSFTPTGKFTASYGNYNDVNLRGYISLPLASDIIAASLSASYQNRRGFNDDIIHGGHDKGLRSALVRGKVLFNLSDASRLTASAYWTKRSDTALYSGQALADNSVGYFYYPDAPRPTAARQTTVGSRSESIFETWGVALRGEFESDPGTFNVISGYTHANPVQYADVDYSPANIATFAPANQIQRTFTQELYFASRKMAGWQFTVGAFYMNVDDSFRPSQFNIWFVPTLAPAPPGPADLILPNRLTTTKDAWAVYAELTYDVMPNLVVTAGGRYAYEKQHASNDDNGALPNLQETPFSPDSFKRFTPRATIRYAIDPRSNVYASYSKGFRSGLVSANDRIQPPVQPEDLEAFEIGYKGRPARGVTFNVAAYLYNYTNLQVTRFAGDTTGAAVVIQNAAKARIKGVDADIAWTATPNLTLSGNLSFIDGKYRDFPGATITVPTGSGGNIDSSIDASGLRMTQAPKFSGSVSADYRREFTPGRVGLFASLFYNDGFKWEYSGRIREKSYVNLDAEISFEPNALPDLRLVLWGRNLTDATVKQSVLSTTFADGVSYAPPATYGVRAEYSF